MKKYIKIKETDLKKIIRRVVEEVNRVDEIYGISDEVAATSKDIVTKIINLDGLINDHNETDSVSNDVMDNYTYNVKNGRFSIPFILDKDITVLYNLYSFETREIFNKYKTNGRFCSFGANALQSKLRLTFQESPLL